MKKSADLKTSKNGSLSPLKRKLDTVLGKPQLLLGDDENQFAQLEALIAAELNPQDILETLWCRDVIERSFEILRLRRWKAQFIELRELGAVKVLLHIRASSFAIQKRLITLSMVGVPAIKKRSIVYIQF